MDFVCIDMPEADKFTIGGFDLLAEKEGDLISERTRAALAEVKRRGVKIANPNPARVALGDGSAKAEDDHVPSRTRARRS